MKEKLGRRDFLKFSAATGVGMAISSNPVLGNISLIKDSKKAVSIAVIGVGSWGSYLLNLASKIEGVVIPAICDINPVAIKKSQEILRKNGHKEAIVYGDHEYACRDLLARNDIDGVIIASNWDWHVIMALDTMKAKKYVGMEVPGARTIEECWDLVNTQESTGTQVMFLENCCYDRESLAIMQMIRDGLFGTPMHATCGYRHAAWGSAKWLRPVNTETKTEHFIKYAALRNADQYPTHGIGPVANWLDINRGNQFSYLTSVSTKAQAINEYVLKHPEGGENHPNAHFEFKQGDIVTTTVKTIKGETIVINYDNYLPRPYSRDYSFQGTNGAWSGLYLGKGIYIEGKSPKHQWEKDKAYDKYMKEYDHTIWKKYSSEAYARDKGHGGMDFFMILDFVKCIREEKKPPIDIYDAAAWSAIIPLSEASLAKGSTPEYFPDFTKGAWKTNAPVTFE